MVVGVVPVEISGHCRKELVELLGQALASANKRGKAFRIVRDEPTLLPGVGLHAALSVLLASFPRKPPAVRSPRTHPANLPAPAIRIGLRVAVVACGDRTLTLTFGKTRAAPVEVGKLKGLGQAAGRIAKPAVVALGLE